MLLQTLSSELSSGCASQVLTWNSHHIDERIKDASGAVRELQELLALVQGTTKQANDLALDWATHSLFELKEGQVSLQAHQRAASMWLMSCMSTWPAMATLVLTFRAMY